MIGRGSITTLSVAAALTLTACGSDEGGSTAAAPSPTTPPPAAAQAKPDKPRQSANFPARFEQRVDRQCKTAEDALQRISHRKGDPMDTLRRMRNVVEDLATDFEATEAPARNRRAWNRYRALFRDGADWVGRIEAEVADGDLEAFERLQSAGVARLNYRTDKLSARYGFRECADD